MSETLTAFSRVASTSTDPLLSRIGQYLSGSLDHPPFELEQAHFDRVDSAVKDLSSWLHRLRPIEALEEKSFGPLQFRDVDQQFFEQLRKETNSEKHPNLFKLFEAMDLATQALSMTPEVDCRILGTLLKPHIFESGQEVERLLDDWGVRVSTFERLSRLELSRDNWILSQDFLELDLDLFVHDFSDHLDDGALRNAILADAERVRILCKSIREFYAALTALARSSLDIAMSRMAENQSMCCCLISSEFEAECSLLTARESQTPVIVVSPNRSAT